jgi:hypothetical protein
MDKIQWMRHSLKLSFGRRMGWVSVRREGYGV